MWRWPDGFVCPKCGSRNHAIVGKRRLYHCRDCRRQTSLKAGAIFAKTLLALTKWFRAMFLITQSKNSISSLELSRQLGVNYDSAWLMRQKLNAVMQANEESRILDGRVEMDDAVMGGELEGWIDLGTRKKNEWIVLALTALHDGPCPLELRSFVARLLRFLGAADRTSLLALSQTHLNLAEQPDNLFSRVSLPCHVLIPSEEFGNSRIRSINMDPF